MDDIYFVSVTFTWFVTKCWRIICMMTTSYIIYPSKSNYVMSFQQMDFKSWHGNCLVLKFEHRELTSQDTQSLWKGRNRIYLILNRVIFIFCTFRYLEMGCGCNWITYWRIRHCNSFVSVDLLQKVSLSCSSRNKM